MILSCQIVFACMWVSILLDVAIFSLVCGASYFLRSVSPSWTLLLPFLSCFCCTCTKGILEIPITTRTRSSCHYVWHRGCRALFRCDAYQKGNRLPKIVQRPARCSYSKLPRTEIRLLCEILELDHRIRHRRRSRAAKKHQHLGRP
jgi:hypothetical protein